MKVIDLLNRIAKGEEVPKKIKFNGFVWTYDIYDKRYYEGENLLFNVLGHYKGIVLNDEVEILEEKKIPEKLKSNGEEFYCDYIDSWIDKKETSAYCEYLMNKYNEIIDYLNSKGDK